MHQKKYVNRSDLIPVDRLEITSSFHLIEEIKSVSRTVALNLSLATIFAVRGLDCG